MANKEKIKTFLIEKERIDENDAKIYKEQLKMELRYIKKVKCKNHLKNTIKFIKVKSEKT